MELFNSEKHTVCFVTDTITNCIECMRISQYYYKFKMWIGIPESIRQWKCYLLVWRYDSVILWFCEHFIYCYSFNYFLPGSAFTIIMLLGNLNSCTNPWIYMYFCGHIPYCTNKQLENTSAQEDSVVTGSIHLVDRDPEENSTCA